MGNSLSFTSFSPKIVNDILGINSYSLGTSNQVIDQSYYELKQLIQYQNPDLVILEANTFISNAKDDPSAKISSSKNISSWVHAMIKAKLPIIENHSAWKLPAELFKNLNDLIHYLSVGKSTGEDDLGFHPLPNISANQTQITEVDKEILNVDQVSLASASYLEEFRFLCAEKGIELLVVKSPDVHISEYNLLFNDKNPQPFDYFDFNKISTGMNWLHFQDVGHLSTFGSVIASVDAAKLISQILNLPLNQSAVDYYSSYFFESLKIDKLEDNYTFTLIPSDPEKSSLLRYKWEVISNEVRILKTEYGVDNFITFPPGLTGEEYSVHVWINNPAGDYVLEGILSYTFD
jgi:hypothetical protein